MAGSSSTIVCASRHLPRHEWPRAATNAIAVNANNRPPGLEEDEIPTGSEGERLALDVTRYWGDKGVSLLLVGIDAYDGGGMLTGCVDLDWRCRRRFRQCGSTVIDARRPVVTAQ